MAWQFITKDGTESQVIFDMSDRPTGRDSRGRFAKKGSPTECHRLGYAMEYRPQEGYVSILGKVALGELMP